MNDPTRYSNNYNKYVTTSTGATASRHSAPPTSLRGMMMVDPKAALANAVASVAAPNVATVTTMYPSSYAQEEAEVEVYFGKKGVDMMMNKPSETVTAAALTVARSIHIASQPPHIGRRVSYNLNHTQEQYGGSNDGGIPSQVYRVPSMNTMTSTMMRHSGHHDRRQYLGHGDGIPSQVTRVPSMNSIVTRHSSNYHRNPRKYDDLRHSYHAGVGVGTASSRIRGMTNTSSAAAVAKAALGIALSDFEDDTISTGSNITTSTTGGGLSRTSSMCSIAAARNRLGNNGSSVAVSSSRRGSISRTSSGDMNRRGLSRTSSGCSSRVARSRLGTNNNCLGGRVDKNTIMPSMSSSTSLVSMASSLSLSSFLEEEDGKEGLGNNTDHTSRAAVASSVASSMIDQDVISVEKHVTFARRVKVNPILNIRDYTKQEIEDKW